ncbi:hypothetical protein BLA29_008099 [Euroglyphus maynei]|uniref:Serine carboxypeptidase CPVL-like protein n=1 Tax=Euroglyphus maynei TaxID=6958 RepID=A0A1Y3BU65_EURMA|nr:hypothetical protein BLA29_008099 [Euroglyphus maynei]
MIDIYVNSIDLNLYNINSDCHTESLQQDESSMNNWNESMKKFNKIMITLPCAMDEHSLTRWLNQLSVKKSLHVPLNFHWSFCNKVDYDRETLSIRDEIEWLIKSGINGLLYAGDLDVVCNFLGVQWFVEDLHYIPMINHTYWKYDGQIGGFYKHYTRSIDGVGGGDGNLTFATVRGAGHSTAVDKPGETKYLFYKFLNQKI